VAVVTNIDPEHLDHYGDFEGVKSAFKTFVNSVPFYGFATLCIDHPVVQGLLPDITDRRVVTYGFAMQAEVRADNIRPQGGGTLYDVYVSANLSDNGQEFIMKDVFLPMFGRHNVQNSLASIAVGIELKIPVTKILMALRSFSGVKRRFTKTGEAKGITVIDDYGHHPVEIAAVLKAGREAVAGTQGRLIAVVQPHRYTRLQSLFADFCTCFNEADSVIVADVYEAGEKPIEGMNKDALAEGIRACGHRHVETLSAPDLLAQQVAAIAKAGDFVICLGAGNITQWAYALPKELAAMPDNFAKAV
jgi:UDP-N-acetylmuramate--alanine ligase